MDHFYSARNLSNEGVQEVPCHRFLTHTLFMKLDFHLETRLGIFVDL